MKNESRSPIIVVSCFYLATCALAPPAAGASPELVTDRPDQTESSNLVPKGYLQLETGWSFARDDTGGVRRRDR